MKLLILIACFAYLDGSCDSPEDVQSSGNNRIFANIITSLICFSCASKDRGDVCSDPFNKCFLQDNDVDYDVYNVCPREWEDAECYKSVLGHLATRGCVNGCTPINYTMQGVGSYCCDTDFCNSASAVSMTTWEVILAAAFHHLRHLVL